VHAGRASFRRKALIVAAAARMLIWMRWAGPMAANDAFPPMHWPLEKLTKEDS
jgi:hypothetical protein